MMANCCMILYVTTEHPDNPGKIHYNLAVETWVLLR